MDLKRHREGSCGVDSSGSGLGPVVGYREHGNERPGSVKTDVLTC
jgi:hypothetical protein